MGTTKLKIAVLYDIWEEEPEPEPEPEEVKAAKNGKNGKHGKAKPQKKKKKLKEDREEIFEALEKLGHEPFYQVLDGTKQSLFSLSRCGANLVFNLTESYAGDDTMDMTPTAVTVGGKSWQAAKPWSTLDTAALARTCFLHHTTLTNNHTNEGKVLKLMGAIKRQEMLVSLCAKSLAPTLGTIQKEPVAVGSETLQYEGRSLPRLTPTGLGR